MMAFKFPLEMKNGVKVRTLEELKDNYNLISIVDYFLNGKLLSWLDSRHYEEANAIKELDLEDEEVGNKLCEIFRVEMTKEIIDDSEKVRNKIRRLIKLRQFTSDINMLRDIDNVAFNQEELDDLFKENHEKIILCNNKFDIPYNRQGLNYILIGNASVENKNAYSSNISDDTEVDFADSPFEQPIEGIEPAGGLEKIMDRINTQPFVWLNNWIIWFHPSNIDDNLIEERYDLKNDKTITYARNKDWNIEQITGNGNEYLFSRTGYSAISIVNVEHHSRVETVAEDRKRDTLFCANNNIVLYQADSRRLIRYNRLSKQKIEIVQASTREKTPDDFWYILSDSYIVYILKENRRRIMYKYDLKTGSRDPVMDLGRVSVKMMETYMDYLYYMVNDEYNGCVSLIRINLNSKNEIPITCFTARSFGNSFISHNCFLREKPYMIFVEPLKSPCVFSYDCNQDVLYSFHLGKEWNRTIENSLYNYKQVVGDYLYFRSRTGKNIYKAFLQSSET